MQGGQIPSNNHYDSILLFDKSGHLMNEDKPIPSM